MKILKKVGRRRRRRRRRRRFADILHLAKIIVARLEMKILAS